MNTDKSVKFVIIKFIIQRQKLISTLTDTEFVIMQRKKFINTDQLQ